MRLHSALVVAVHGADGVHAEALLGQPRGAVVLAIVLAVGQAARLAGMRGSVCDMCEVCDRVWGKLLVVVAVVRGYMRAGGCGGCVRRRAGATHHAGHRTRRGRPRHHRLDLFIGARQYGVFRLDPRQHGAYLVRVHHLASHLERYKADPDAYMADIPLTAALKAAIRDNDPVVFLESEKMYGDKGEVPESEYLVPIGQAKIVQAGTDVTLVTFGKMLSRVVMPAVEALQKEGISVEVIDLRTVRPIDYATVVASVKKTNRCVVVEEAWPLAAISSEITYHLQRNAFDYLDAPVIRVNSMDIPLHYAPTLIEATLPNVERTVKAVKEVLYKK